MESKNSPSFLEGYCSGKPVYMTVRVLDYESVMNIENQVYLKESGIVEDLPSEVTLV